MQQLLLKYLEAFTTGKVLTLEIEEIKKDLQEEDTLEYYLQLIVLDRTELLIEILPLLMHELKHPIQDEKIKLSSKYDLIGLLCMYSSNESPIISEVSMVIIEHICESIIEKYPARPKFL